MEWLEKTLIQLKPTQFQYTHSILIIYSLYISICTGITGVRDG